MARVVLSDASPLIGLAIVDGLIWLPELFGDVWVPPSVHREVLPGVSARGEAKIAAAVKRKAIRVWRKSIPATKIALPSWTKARPIAFELRCRTALARR